MHCYSAQGEVATIDGICEYVDYKNRVAVDQDEIKRVLEAMVRHGTARRTAAGWQVA